MANRIQNALLALGSPDARAATEALIALGGASASAVCEALHAHQPLGGPGANGRAVVAFNIAGEEP